jgi:hypothetical protein
MFSRKLTGPSLEDAGSEVLRKLAEGVGVGEKKMDRSYVYISSLVIYILCT